MIYCSACAATAADVTSTRSIYTDRCCTADKRGLTIREAKDIVSALGARLAKNEYGEYVIKGSNSRGGFEYFGGDLADAVGTARAILRGEI